MNRKIDSNTFGPVNALILSVAFAAFAGCGPKTVESSRPQEPVVFGPQYKASKGLLVPEDTRKSLALETTEVTEQAVQASFSTELRVYRVDKESTLASGMISPERAQLLKLGQPVEIKNSDGKIFAGKVSRLDAQLQKATGSIELIIEIPEAPEPLSFGAFLQATVTLASNENVVTIPRSALLQCSDGHSVYTVNGDHLVRTPVKIGSFSGGVVEVKDGLFAGDQVVSQPVLSLWMAELAAVKGGQACCVAPAKGK